MSDKHSNEKLEDLRERLYARGETPRKRQRTELKSENTQPAENKNVWSDIKGPSGNNPAPNNLTNKEEEVAHLPPRMSFFRRHRNKFIIVGLAFFVLSVIISSIYMLLGQNTVSGNNIAVSVSGPLSVGGGEVIPIQVGITNNNSVAIESATLVVEYPPGTRSDEGEGEELFSERIEVPEAIASGETRNISVEARVFGEENQEQEINISIEYRVTGSSATFFKEADSLRFKISHAPVVLDVDANETVSAGQETNITLTITSNSASPIYDLIVKADYPSGFTFVSSEPSTMSGRNIWSIDEIQPEESVSIELVGTLQGDADESRVVKFAAGVASQRNPGELASVLAVADKEFSLEVPFISTKVTVGGSTNEVVTVAPDTQTTMTIEVENSSSATVYDAEITVDLSGNALVDSQVSVNNGYYDSNKRTVTFDQNSYPRLGELRPGANERLSFSLELDPGIAQSPQVVAKVSVTGRRVSENSSQEEISDAVSRTIKVEGSLLSAGRVVDVTDGPVPPVVGRSTDYRIELDVENNSNDVSGAIVTATLPVYMEWLGNESGNGAWNYNSSTRTIEWRVGSIGSGEDASGTFGVSITPSTSLRGRVPTLVDNIQLRADDNFTGSVVRASGGAVSAELANQEDSGTVQAN